MDRDALSAMLQKVRAMKTMSGGGSQPASVLAIANLARERQKLRAVREEDGASESGSDVHTLESGSVVRAATNTSPGSISTEESDMISIDQRTVTPDVPAVPKRTCDRWALHLAAFARDLRGVAL